MECQKVARDEGTNDLSIKADDYYGNRFFQGQQQVDHLVMDHPGEQEHCSHSVEIASEFDYLWIVRENLHQGLSQKVEEYTSSQHYDEAVLQCGVQGLSNPFGLVCPIVLTRQREDRDTEPEGGKNDETLNTNADAVGGHSLGIEFAEKKRGDEYERGNASRLETGWHAESSYFPVGSRRLQLGKPSLRPPLSRDLPPLLSSLEEPSPRRWSNGAEPSGRHQWVLPFQG